MLYQCENPHGGDIYEAPVELDFSASVNPLGPPASVRRAVVECAGRLDRYPDPFCRALTAGLSACEGVPAGHILCGGGAAELIYAWCAAARPRRALIPVPSFSEYEAALRASGGAAEYFPLRAEEDFCLDGRFLAALEQTDCGAVFLCQPNNPTGRLIGAELLEKTVDICRARGIRLFMDECFLDLTDAGQAFSARRYLAESPGLFILRAFTKTYGMAGLRLGYGLSADEGLLRAMSAGTQPWNVSLPAQAAGIAALDEGAYLARARQLIRAERARLSERLRGLGLRVVPSEANFILFRADPALGARLRARGVLIRDCQSFPGLGPGWYRAAVRTRAENERLIGALEGVM